MNESRMEMQRGAFGETLVELGFEMPELVVLDVDVSSSVKTDGFARQFPERHFNFGAAEQNMIMHAAGFAAAGLTPLACTYANFAVLRACEQIRSFICYANLNVKIIATHSGIEVGADGPTHHATEDIAITRAMPNMTVIAPADAAATAALFRQALRRPGPVYFRMGRGAVPLLYPHDKSFEIGKAVQIRAGNDITLIAIGNMVSTALEAAKELAKEDIDAGVLDMHTIKPVDEEALLFAARNTSAIITLEDHSIIGGLGGAVSEFLTENHPVPVFRVGVRDQFTESGDPSDLFRKYQMDTDAVIRIARRALRQRQQ